MTDTAENTIGDTTRLTIAQASRRFGVPADTIRSRIERGVLPSYTAEDGYHVLVSPEDVASWQDGRKEPRKQRQRGANAYRVETMYNDGYSDRRIATALGITHQRVSQLRRAAGLPRLSKAVLGTTCLQCGERFAPEKRGQNRCTEHRRTAAKTLAFACQVCGVAFERRASTIRANSPGNYCSHACRDQAKRGHYRGDSILKRCTECGKDYMGLASAKWSACTLCRPHVTYRARALRRKLG